ncbi:MAG: 50S ribosomal protein L30 [Firmicutes bacterium]|nr:50S ribosomal protein L30 [Bacillota bacterium]
MDAKKLKIKWKRSTIGSPKDQKATIRALGLKKLNDEVIHDNTPVIQGMIFKVQHLVEVTEVD